MHGKILRLLILAVLSINFLPSLNYAQAFHQSSMIGPQSVAVISVRFLDVRNVKTVEEIRSTVFTGLNNYLKEVSYGAASIVGEIAPSWYDLSKPILDYNSRRGQLDLIRDAVRAADADMDLTKHKFIIIVFAGDDQFRSGNPRDLKSFATNDPIKLTTSNGAIKASVIAVAERDPIGPYAHELLFAAGIPILWVRTETGMVDVVGEWCLMGHGYWAGNGSMPVHPCGWTKVKLGWIPSDNIQEIQVGQVATITLERLETNANGQQLLKLPLTDKTYYLIEVRDKYGFDRNLPSSGVIITLIDENKVDGEGPVRVMDANPETQSLDDAAFRSGDFFQDVNAKVAVFVLGQQGSAYKVKVDRSGLIQQQKLTIKVPTRNISVKIDNSTRVSDSNGVVKAVLPTGQYRVEIPAYVSIGKGVRYSFSGWNDGLRESVRSVSLNSNTVLAASYRIQYLLTLSTKIGSTFGAGWYGDGENAKFGVSSPIDLGNGTRWIFGAWNGDTDAETPEATILMNGPKTISPIWKRQYRVEFMVRGAPEGTPLSLSLNGQTRSMSASAYVEWFEEGAYVSAKLDPTEIAVDRGTVALRRWENSTGVRVGSDFVVDKPETITAVYEGGKMQAIQPSRSQHSKTSNLRVDEMTLSVTDRLNNFLASQPYTAPTRVIFQPIAEVVRMTNMVYAVLSPVPWLSAIAASIFVGFMIGAIYALPAILIGLILFRISSGKSPKANKLIPLAVIWLLSIVPVLLIPFVPAGITQTFQIVSIVALLFTTLLISALAIALKIVGAFKGS